MQTMQGRLIEDLGDGLIVRHATPADAEELSEFNALIQADPGMERDEGIGIWTRDLIHRPPPTFAIDDFTVVEDTRTGRIVSTLNLISQTWSYAGVPFGVGQVEIVSTDPAYRRRGLVRKQFAIAHRWSEQRGQLVQVVSGIPWYYRQYGYEMCVSHNNGRTCRVSQVPALAKGIEELYRVRPATAADVPFIARVAEQAARRYLLTCMRDDALWRYEIEGHSAGSAVERAMGVIETADGERAGYLAHFPRLLGLGLAVTGYELTPGRSWVDVTPSVLRHLVATGREYAQRDGVAEPATLFFVLESEHPLYDAAPRLLTPSRGSYAWYVRVPDLSRFLAHVAPVLERRLASSVAAGYSGEVKLNFFRSGVRLAFEQGRLTSAEPWEQPDRNEATASLPDLTFLHLLFGHRTLAEVDHIYPDCDARTERGQVLIDILFPKQASLVWQVS
ncbi:MAG: GNAT family N-acetyltransferase [Dehalococcoidia bacterium]